jgi:radical SAM superfamily enzyme YgiQ (UPF0313 family)
VRVLLIQPALGGRVGFERLAQVEPLALEYLAAALPEHEVRLLDLRQEDNLDAVLESFRPQLAGLSCSFTVAAYPTLRAAERIKASLPECFVLLGGHHASMLPEQFRARCVDAICLGEGEEVIRDVVGVLEERGELASVPGLALNRDGRQVRTARRGQLANLDALPVPRRELGGSRRSYYFHFWRPLALLETTRGCPQRCSFCSVWRFYRGRTRTKSAARVLEELAALKERKILVTDDNFFADLDRAHQLADLVRGERLRKHFSVQVRADTVAANPELVAAWYEAGMRHVFLGLEAISDEGLDRLHKQSSRAQADRALQILRRHRDLGITGSFIVEPGFTAEDFASLAAYVSEQSIPSPTYSVLTPLPGSSLFRELRGQLQTGNCDCFDLLHAVLPTRLEPARFAAEFAALYQRSYSAGSILSGRALRTLRGLLSGRYSLRQVLRVLSAFRSMQGLESYLLPSPTVPPGMPDLRRVVPEG